MRFSPTGWSAIYEASNRQRPLTELLVEAWGPDGKALVVNEETGCLVEATSLPGFSQLRGRSRIVAATTAAPGWQLQVWNNDKDDDSTFLEPIVVWLVDQDGCVFPVGGTNDSWLEPSLNQRTQILPPIDAPALTYEPPKAGPE